MNPEDMNDEEGMQEEPQVAAQMQPQAQQTPAEKMYSQEQVNQMIRSRLKNKAGSRQREMEAAQPAQDMSQYIHVSQIPDIINQNVEKTKLVDKATMMNQKVSEAAEKDPELKELMAKGNALTPVDQIAIAQMDMLPNMPALIKDLLKNKESYQLFQMAQTPYEKSMFLRERSRELDNSKMMKGTTYTPTPDVGGGASDDVATSSISRYTKKR